MAAHSSVAAEEQAMDRTTEILARYATTLTYRDLTPTTVHEVKRKLIDALGCALGGYDSEPSVIARRLAAARTGAPAARVLGDNHRTTPEMAAFANAVMVRYLDANDTYISPINGTGHPSDMVPGLIAVAEAYGASCQELILAIVASYEAFGALADAVQLRERGWDQGLYVVLGSAIGAGKLLGLSLAQLADAIAIAVTANVPTRQNRAGELAMWKGAATPAATSAGVFAALLAKEGMTGPTAAFEGRDGIWQQVTGQFALGPMGGQDGKPFMIEQANLKYFLAEFHSQAPLWMALRLRERVKPDEIARLNMRTYWMAYSEIGSEPAKWDPQTRETADHSLPYLLAMALRDGAITAATFDLDRVRDPSLRPLMNRITISESEELTRQFPAALPSEMEVITTAGERIVERSDYPRGHVRNPMTDDDVAAKFRSLAEPALGTERSNAALDALWRLDQGPSLGPLLDLFTIVQG
jgi:2-methylcitrate dehydratase